MVKKKDTDVGRILQDVEKLSRSDKIKFYKKVFEDLFKDLERKRKKAVSKR